MHLKEKWKAVVEDWKKSGLSQATYCRRTGINPTRLSYWKKKLSIEEIVLDKSNKIEQSEFVEVGGVDSEAFEIRIGSLVISIPKSTESKKIAELVNCLS